MEEKLIRQSCVFLQECGDGKHGVCSPLPVCCLCQRLQLRGLSSSLGILLLPRTYILKRLCWTVTWAGPVSEGFGGDVTPLGLHLVVSFLPQMLEWGSGHGQVNAPLQLCLLRSKGALVGGTGHLLRWPHVHC